MRVLFLTDSLSDLDGVGRYAMRLIAALEEQQPGLEVEVLLARKHRPTSCAVDGQYRGSKGRSVRGRRAPWITFGFS